MKYFAGVGSRETPINVLNTMSFIAFINEKHGYILRSGGAEGADAAFAKGCSLENQEIYVPWKNFNKVPNGIYEGNVKEGEIVASEIHEAWHRCSHGAKKLHTRNTFQVLGPNPISNPIPVDFVVCYTKGGLDIGGTRTAIMLAKRNNIPVFNLGIYDYVDKPTERVEDWFFLEYVKWLKETFGLEKIKVMFCGMDDINND